MPFFRLHFHQEIEITAGIFCLQATDEALLSFFGSSFIWASHQGGVTCSSLNTSGSLLQLHYPKITKTDYTKKAAGNCSQGKLAVKEMHLKERSQQNNDENRTRKQKTVQVLPFFFMKLCILLEQDMTDLSCSVCLIVRLSEHLAFLKLQISPSVQARISGKNTFLK